MSRTAEMQQEQKTSKKAKKTHSTFFKAAWAFVGVMAVLIITVLLVLWNFLGNYERSDPRYYLDQVVTLLENKQYEEAAKRSGFEETTFFTFERFESYVTEVLGDTTDLKVLEMKSTQENERHYRVIGENGELKFILTEEPNTLGFGFSSYSVKIDLGSGGTWKIVAPQEIVVSVDDVVLDESYRIDEKMIPTPFETLKDDSVAPKLAVYEVSGLYTTPVVTAENAEIVYDEKENTVRITDSLKTPEASREEMIINAAKTYAAFISGDAQMKDVAALLYPETEFYDSIKTYSSYWYIDHDSAEAENVKLFNYTEYAQDVFSAEVTFDYRVKRTRGNINQVYPTHYRLSFMNIDGSIKLVNIEVL